MKTYIITTAVIRKDNKFLIAKRAEQKKFAPNRMEFISGFADTSETAEEIILREISEELHVQGIVKDRAEPFTFVDTEGRWIVVPFLVEISSDISINKVDHSDVRWVKENDLESYLDLAPFLGSAEFQKLLHD